MGTPPSAFELPKAAVAPRPQRQQKRGTETPFAPAPVALHDFGALPRGVAQSQFDLPQRRLRCDSSMEEKLLLRSGEMTGHKLAQKFLVNVALHGPAGTPAEMPADQQAHAVPRLQFDDLQLIQFVEELQDLALGEGVRAHDLLERCAVKHQPRDQEQPGIRDDLLLLRQRELIDGGAIARSRQNIRETRLQQFADQVHPPEREVAAAREQALDAGDAQIQLVGDGGIGEPALAQGSLQLRDDQCLFRHEPSRLGACKVSYNATLGAIQRIYGDKSCSKRPLPASVPRESQWRASCA